MTPEDKYFQLYNRLLDRGEVESIYSVYRLTTLSTSTNAHMGRKMRSI